MAEKAYSTVTWLPHQADAKFAYTAEGWESEICDLADMASLTTSVVEGIIRHHTQYPDAGLSDDSKRHIFFCIYQLNRRAADLKEHFYEALNLRGAA